MSSDDIVVPTDFVPERVGALLAWNPRELAVAVAPSAPNIDVSTTVDSETISFATRPPTTRSSKVASLTNFIPTRINTSTRGLNRTTRAPTFYDLHLAEHLRLKFLKSMRSLASFMAAAVDNYIKKIFDSGRQLPADVELLQTGKQLARKTRDAIKRLENEEGIVENYKDLTASFCLPVASTLALHPSYPEWCSRLTWTRAPKSELGRHAIPDGMLRITPADSPVSKAEESAIFDYLEPDIKSVFPTLEQRTLATWEMKSLTVGDFKVMNAIYEKARRGERFDWTKCKGDCGRLSHVNMHATEEQIPRGVDALHPPWTLPDPGEEPVGERQSSRLRQDPDPLQAPVAPEPSSPESDADQPTPPEIPEIHSGTKRKYDSGPGAKRKQDPDPDHPDPRGGREYVTSHSFLQQAWAQAVRHKSTILVLHSGNYEIIGIRHRASQTLYLSDMIEPHKSEPRYGKIHVGLYIAAIQETLDRIRQEQEMPEPPTNAPGPDDDVDDAKEEEDGQGSSKRHKFDHPKSRGSRDRGHSKGQGRGRSKGRKAPQGQKKGNSGTVDQATFNAASTRNIAYVHLFYGIYASPAPAVFVRQEPVVHSTATPPLFPGRDGVDKHDKSIDIILTSEKAPGSTGIVHLGRMAVEPFGLNIPIAAKLAFASYEKDALKHEYHIYMHLQSKGVKGIPRCFGLFAHDEAVEDTEGPHALIMTFAGRSLYNRASSLSAAAKKSLLITLKSIHKAGVVHGDVRLANLCVNGEGKAFVIDFSHAKISSSLARMDYEIADLCALLDIKDTTTEHENIVNSNIGLRRSARIKEAAEKKANDERRTAKEARTRRHK